MIIAHWRPGEVDGNGWHHIKRLLAESDSEFLPALSSRLDTQSLTAVPESAVGPERYAASMTRESILAACLGRAVHGFLSFRSPYHGPELRGWTPCAYVSTVIVGRQYRRRGIATALYDALDDYTLSEDLRFVVTRTWSTNRSHVRLLVDRGFGEIARVQDERGAGVDTVAFACPVTPSSSHVGGSSAR